jgi:hypothetical protein
VKLLRALGRAVTSFADELWPYSFPPAWFDPGEALEDEIISKGVFAESSSALDGDDWCCGHAPSCEVGGIAYCDRKRPQSSPVVERPGSHAPGEPPGGSGHSPAPAAGHPKLTQETIRRIVTSHIGNSFGSGDEIADDIYYELVERP